MGKDEIVKSMKRVSRKIHANMPRSRYFKSSYKARKEEYKGEFDWEDEETRLPPRSNRNSRSRTTGSVDSDKGREEEN
jgi:hypothetical protein